MQLEDIEVGDIIQFITKVDNSRKDEDIQNVILKVTEITSTHIKGINAIRALDLDDRPYRSYKISNIIANTVWKKVA